MQVITIDGTPRTEVGKRATKAVRNEGLIPAVLYGGEKVLHFNTKAADVKDLIYTPDFKTAKITVDGTAYNCIIKEVQYHPVTDEIVHIDFLHLVDGATVKVEVPVRFKGTSPGVKQGGKLIQNVRRVKIKTTPEHLVDELLLDISSMNLGSSIRVRDIEVGEGIEIMNSPGIPIASVEIPRALRSATAAAEKEAGKKK